MKNSNKWQGMWGITKQENKQAKSHLVIIISWAWAKKSSTCLGTAIETPDYEELSITWELQGTLGFICAGAFSWIQPRAIVGPCPIVGLSQEKKTLETVREWNSFTGSLTCSKEASLRKHKMLRKPKVKVRYGKSQVWIIIGWNPLSAKQLEEKLQCRGSLAGRVGHKRSSILTSFGCQIKGSLQRQSTQPFVAWRWCCWANPEHEALMFLWAYSTSFPFHTMLSDMLRSTTN